MAPSRSTAAIRPGSTSADSQALAAAKTTSRVVAILPSSATKSAGAWQDAAQASVAAGVTLGVSPAIASPETTVSALSALLTATKKATAAPPVPPDTTPPTTPQDLMLVANDSSSVTVTWTASTDTGSGVSGYSLSSNGVQVSTTTSTSAVITGLTCGTTYTIGVAAIDGAGNSSPPATLVASTYSCPPKKVSSASGTADLLPPTAPFALTSTSVGQTTISLSWVASTDNIGVTGYDVYENGSQMGSATGTTYNLIALTCGTSYTFAVDAFDAAGNHSTQTSAAISTAACATSDIQAPTVPTGLTVGSATQTSVVLSWVASSDNVGVVGYDAFVNGSSVGSPTGISYTFTGLACGTSYSVGGRCF